MAIKKNISQQCDTLIIIGVFAIACVYVISYFDVRIFGQPPLTKEILPFFHRNQIYMNVEELVISLILLWKAYRLGSCIFTKIATWMYVSLVVSGSLYLFRVIPYGWLMTFGQYGIIIGMFTMCFAYFFWLCFRKFGK